LVNTASNLDLLRDRRDQLGLPEPDAGDPLRPLLLGAALGGALVGVVLLAAAGLALLNRSSAAELQRLTPVQGRVEALQARIKEERSRRVASEKTSRNLAQALVAVRSGSALLEDLRRRAPSGVQFSETRVERDQLRLKGLAADPDAFARINALQLALMRSPLLEPGRVVLIKASREAGTSQTGPAAPSDSASSASAVPGPVLFELTARFRPAGGGADLATLRSLGADGMAARLQTLLRAGVLR
jgi:type IV pilus assembly protein PilN